MFNKVVLVIGAGSIGGELINRLSNTNAVGIFDNSEIRLHELRMEYRGDSRFYFYLGDIRDKQRLEEVVEGHDVIINCAALKHVSFCDENPFDAVQTNILGTKNIIDIAKKHKKQLINISTDKAVYPINVMGATKLITERLVEHYWGSSVRLGNIAASSGSVVEIFKKQIRNGEKLTITDPNMTRFMMPIEEAAKFIIKISDMPAGCYIKKMPAVRVIDIAHAVDMEADIDIIGKHKIEKIHEILLTEEELENAYENEEMIVLPYGRSKLNILNGFKKCRQAYSSDKAKLLSIDEIKKLL